MIKKYLPFLILGPASNILWATWALSEINEQGTFGETMQWIATQALLPILLGILVALRSKIGLWLLTVYSGFVLLFGIGILGWALMGPATPLSVYVVCFILFVMGFGLLYQSMKDLKIGKKARRDYAQDE